MDCQHGDFRTTSQNRATWEVQEADGIMHFQAADPRSGLLMRNC